LKDEYKNLKFEIQDLDNKAEFLKTRVKECEDDYDQMDELIMLKQLEIEQLEKTAGVKAPEIKTKLSQRTTTSAYYRAIKGDLVDEMVGEKLTEMQCALPVRRLQDGYYLFGTLKVYVKVMKGKLIVKSKSGGGYLDFQSFVEENLMEQK